MNRWRRSALGCDFAKRTENVLGTLSRTFVPHRERWTYNKQCQRYYLGHISKRCLRDNLAVLLMCITLCTNRTFPKITSVFPASLLKSVAKKRLWHHSNKCWKQPNENSFQQTIKSEISSSDCEHYSYQISTIFLDHFLMLYKILL